MSARMAQACTYFESLLLLISSGSNHIYSGFERRLLWMGKGRINGWVWPAGPSMDVLDNLHTSKSRHSPAFEFIYHSCAGCLLVPLRWTWVWCTHTHCRHRGLQSHFNAIGRPRLRSITMDAPIVQTRASTELPDDDLPGDVRAADDLAADYGYSVGLSPLSHNVNLPLCL